MDKNKPKLQDYSPGNNVWSSIEQQLEGDSLREKLNQHTPKENIWNSIEDELNVTTPLQHLPTHSPPAKIWDNIIESQPKARTLAIYTWMKVAASVALVFGLAYTLKLMNLDGEVESELVYTEVWINPLQPENWDLETDRNIEILIANKEAESPTILESEEYLELKTEFKTLQQSKEAILQELTPYNDNIELELLLTKIELEKNSLIRNLISFSHV